MLTSFCHPFPHFLDAISARSRFACVDTACDLTVWLPRASEQSVSWFRYGAFTALNATHTHAYTHTRTRTYFHTHARPPTTGAVSGKLNCSEPRCDCRRFDYLVSTGAWVARCSCKHKAVDHTNRKPYTCTKRNCECAAFHSPFVCNCDHKWETHRTTRFERQVKSFVTQYADGLADPTAVMRGLDADDDNYDNNAAAAGATNTPSPAKARRRRQRPGGVAAAQRASGGRHVRPPSDDVAITREKSPRARPSGLARLDTGEPERRFRAARATQSPPVRSPEHRRAGANGRRVREPTAARSSSTSVAKVVNNRKDRRAVATTATATATVTATATATETKTKAATPIDAEHRRYEVAAAKVQTAARRRRRQTSAPKQGRTQRQGGSRTAATGDDARGSDANPSRRGVLSGRTRARIDAQRASIGRRYPTGSGR